MGYTTREVEKLVGLKPAQVRALLREGVLSPTRGRGRQLLFTFQDLVLLRTARALLDAEVPASQVGRALSRLQARLPDGAPLAGMHIRADGRNIVVREGPGLWSVESGQAVFDFDVEQLARDVASLERARARAESEAARAEASRRSALAKQPDDAEHYYREGCAIEERDPDAARAAYEQALARDPRHLEARINLGRLLHDAGELEAALSHYRQAAAIAPSDTTAAFNLAVVLEDLGRLNEAAEWYRQAIKAEPEFADAHFNLSRLLEQMGERASALRHLQAYRKLTRR